MMEMYNANRYQPDICLSLTSEWLTKMIVSPHEGKKWCALANAAAANSAFYNQHKADQAELTPEAQVANLAWQLALLRIVNANTPQHAEDFLGLYHAHAPILESLVNKTTDKVKLLRKRRLRVLRSEPSATLDVLKAEFSRLSENPRYYLVSVKAKIDRSHSIAVVSTKRTGIFSPRGHLYYYDPNLFRVVRWTSRKELNGFLDRSLLHDYASVNLIWQVERV